MYLLGAARQAIPPEPQKIQCKGFLFPWTIQAVDQQRSTSTDPIGPPGPRHECPENPVPGQGPTHLGWGGASGARTIVMLHCRCFSISIVAFRSWCFRALRTPEVTIQPPQRPPRTPRTARAQGPGLSGPVWDHMGPGPGQFGTIWDRMGPHGTGDRGPGSIMGARVFYL